MSDVYRDGYIWNSDISGQNLSRENRYGTMHRSNTFPGGPYFENFIPKTQDQMIYDDLKSGRIPVIPNELFLKPLEALNKPWYVSTGLSDNSESKENPE